MDPFIFGVVTVLGASVAAAIRASRKRRAQRVAAPRELGSGAASTHGGASVTVPASSQARVGDVLSYLGDEYWLSGELALVREGSVALRLFSAPEKGRERWVALPRDGRSLWVLFVDPALASVGWPGVEVPVEKKMFRRGEQARVAIVPSGEAPKSWEGVGRYATFRALDGVAVVVESAALERLALVGREIPWQLVEKVG